MKHSPKDAEPPDYVVLVWRYVQDDDATTAAPATSPCSSNRPTCPVSVSRYVPVQAAWSGTLVSLQLHILPLNSCTPRMAKMMKNRNTTRDTLAIAASDMVTDLLLSRRRVEEDGISAVSPTVLVEAVQQCWLRRCTELLQHPHSLEHQSHASAAGEGPQRLDSSQHTQSLQRLGGKVIGLHVCAVDCTQLCLWRLTAAPTLMRAP